MLGSVTLRQCTHICSLYCIANKLFICVVGNVLSHMSVLEHCGISCPVLLMASPRLHWCVQLFKLIEAGAAVANTHGKQIEKIKHVSKALASNLMRLDQQTAVFNDF